MAASVFPSCHSTAVVKMPKENLVFFPLLLCFVVKLCMQHTRLCWLLSRPLLSRLHLLSVVVDVDGCVNVLLLFMTPSPKPILSPNAIALCLTSHRIRKTVEVSLHTIVSDLRVSVLLDFTFFTHDIFNTSR